ncbi:sigma factor-like helix-turn-helix DNA-binding protein, partial [Rhodopirellula bahusiensis]|uniref:sigma factor-like helix-turn-helix DNA-binding protein n=1 Tax=Rhodopirellula bahusiensis TaxID=2014065 RepID=UPI00326721CA
ERIANLQSLFHESSRTDELHHFPTWIDQLAGRARKICDLRYQKGLKPAAISEQIGMTANSVAKALQRIREQLRECIEDKFVSEGANG